MPETPDPKIREHPHRMRLLPAPPGVERPAMFTPERTSGTDEARSGRDFKGLAYAELHVRSNFTFLTGASHPEELVEQAARLGHAAAAITDTNSLAGVVRAHVAAKQVGIPLAVGAELVFELGRPAPARSGWSGGSVLVFPTCRASYAGLSQLLTTGKRRAPKGECHLELEDLLERQAGLLAVAVPAWGCDESFGDLVERLRGVFDDDRLSVGVRRAYAHDDGEHAARVSELCARLGAPMVVTNGVLAHAPERRELQDVLACIRHGCTVEQAGRRLEMNAERHLKSGAEMLRLFAEHPRAVARAAEVAKRASAFSLDEIRYQYPSEVCPPGRTPMEHLRDLTLRGAVRRYKSSVEGPVPPSIRKRLDHEFGLIEKLNYPQYFLTVHDIVKFARGRGILCQGRGAAANSAVCYCLGITSVDPTKIDLLFERFVSLERNEPPDIDIDFEHERREEVIQYIYSKYGRHRAALTAEVISYRSRSAVRDVGKALGLSLDAVDRMAKSLDWWDRGSVRAARLRELGLNPDDPTILRVIRLTEELLGFPRHLSQHVGGFVITQDPLSDLVPIENASMEDRTVIEWDKDDIDAMGFLKVDCLGLGMLTCIGRAFRLVEKVSRCQGVEVSRGEGPQVSRLQGAEVSREKGGRRTHFALPLTPGHLDTLTPQQREKVSRCQGVEVSSEEGVKVSRCRGVEAGPETKEEASLVSSSTPWHLDTSTPQRFNLSNVPDNDPTVYDAICRADTIGVFQIESRAQMSMLPRLRPRCFYDLVIEVAIVRPGPIQGDMVHPYLRRRNGEEKIEYPSDEVKAVLGRTLGVPLFQEQAMKLAIVAAGFSAGEADQLRRAMAAWKRKGDRLLAFEERFIGGMLKNGYKQDFAERCFNQLKGFSEYGFPESHAASFAHLVYVSAWLKHHHPAAFAAALINSQPMGFYAPAQIVRDAQEHGVEVRAVDANLSGWECSLEGKVSRCRGGEVARGEGRKEESVASSLAPRHLGTLTPSSVALRLGMRLVKGLSEAEARRIEAAVAGEGPFGDVSSLHRASGVSVGTLRRLAQADAFGSMGLDRQRALWEVRALRDEEEGLFGKEVSRGRGGKVSRGEENEEEASLVSPLTPRNLGTLAPSLPDIPLPKRVIHDYGSLGLSLKAHPVSFLRGRLEGRGVMRNVLLRDERACPTGRAVRVAGIVLVRQRPATASGVVFFTIEDETGIANLIVRPKIYERYRRDARHSVLIMATGKVERQGEVVHVLVSRITALDEEMRELTAKSRDFH